MKKLYLIPCLPLVLMLGNSSNILGSEVPIVTKIAVFNFTIGANTLVSELDASEGAVTSEIIRADIPFSDVGVHWEAKYPPGSEILIEIRTSKDGNFWTAWKQVSIISYPEENPKKEFFGFLVGVDQRDRTHEYIQYRVKLIPNEDMTYPLLERISFTFIDAGVTPRALLENINNAVQEDTHFSYPLSIRSSSIYPKPTVVSRAGWGANESWMTWTPQYQTVTHNIIHHTDTPNNDTDWPARIRSIYYYHAVTLGWGDIGYNYLVDANGVLYEGRYGGDDVIGAHAYGYNDGSMGLSFLGSYGGGSYGGNTTPSTAMLTSGERLLAWKCSQRNIDPLGSGPDNDGAVYSYVSGHRDVGSTTCPGDDLYALLPTIRTNVKNLIGGPSDTTPPTISSFSVTPLSLTLGNPFTISYTVSDTGMSGLNRVELQRTPDNNGIPGTWAHINTNSVSGDGPVSGSFSDAPTSVGSYWYGIHAVDNEGNRKVEPNPPGPIKVTVISAISTPTVETRSATDITSTATTVNGYITDSGGANIDERRFDWGTTASCSDGWTRDVTVSGNSFSYRLGSLTPGTTYYFRAWAHNSAGWGQGNVLSFTTLLSETVSTPNTPSGQTSGTTGTSYIYATGGAISNQGHPVEYQFDWKGDGSDLSSWGSPTQSKTWTAAGTYYVRARARCATHSSIVSSWSGSLTVSISAPAETVSAPNSPAGQTNGTTGTSYTYATGGASSNIGHSLEYRFDWGDGTYSNWSSSTSSSKSWSSAGTYSVRAQARCATHTSVVSSWSSGLSVTISAPETVSIPSTPGGPTSGTPVTSYSYSTGGSSSNLGHSVQYFFDWGDGTNSGWLAVGTTSASKSWATAGTFSVRAQARCATHTSIVSSWSGALSVTISAPETVSTPSTFSGPTSGNTGTNYIYSTGGASSNFGHSVQYLFDWGDGTNSGWLPVGETTTSTSWASSGTYSVRARARCATHTTVISNWSNTYTVSITAPAGLKGDVNGDETIDLADSIMALQVISGLNPQAVHLEADVNGDRKIGMEEVLYTLQVLSAGRGY